MNQIYFSYMNYSYQAYAGGGAPLFVNSGFNALFKVGITDLLEDYRITGSIRPEFDLSNMEYFFSFENLRDRLDKQFIFHRQGLQNYVDENLTSQQTHELLYILKWPFSEVRAIKGTAILRNDRHVFKALDLGTLQAENIARTRYGVKAENCTLISSRRKFMAAAQDLGFQITPLNREETLLSALEALLVRVQEQAEPQQTSAK